MDRPSPRFWTAALMNAAGSEFAGYVCRVLSVLVSSSAAAPSLLAQTTMLAPSAAASVPGKLGMAADVAST